MTREKKAHSLGQEYFPDERNIWARPKIMKLNGFADALYKNGRVGAWKVD